MYGKNKNGVFLLIRNVSQWLVIQRTVPTERAGHPVRQRWDTGTIITQDQQGREVETFLLSYLHPSQVNWKYETERDKHFYESSRCFIPTADLWLYVW